MNQERAKPATMIPAHTTGRREARISNREERHAQADQAHVAETTEGTSGGHAADDGSQSLQRLQYPEERGSPAQPELDDCEEERLGKPDHQQARSGREDDLPQRQRGEDMSHARRELSEEVLLFALDSRLGRAHEEECHRKADERETVRDRNDPATERRIETRA